MHDAAMVTSLAGEKKIHKTLLVRHMKKGPRAKLWTAINMFM